MGFKIKNGVLEQYVEEEGVTEVVIPDTVTSIGNWAFSECSSLTSITIPDTVTSIGKDAFSRCSNLTSITIPDSVKSIGDDAFSDCSSLTSITIPDSVTSIGGGAFSSCSNLTSIIIPDSVTSIGGSAFSGCSNLTSITIPDSVTSIGISAFKYCSNLKSITIPDSVTSIGEYAFSDCSSLTSITISDSVTSIGEGAFSRCSNLTSITIPDSVTSIGNGAFIDCSNLKSITIPDSVTSIGINAFGYCSNLKSITIPDSVTSIGEYAFWDCKKLKNFSIPTEKQLLIKDVFGYEFPSGLTDKAMYLSSAMKDVALKQYILTNKIWKILSAEERFTLFMTRQSKICLPAFIEVIDKKTASDFVERMLKTLNTKSSAKECNAVADFILSFNGLVSQNILKKLYSSLKDCKNGAKAAANIEKDKALLTKLAEADVEMSEIERMTTDIMTSKNISVIQLEKTFQDFYSLKIKSLPEVKDTDGNVIPAYCIAYLLTAHEQNNTYSDVFPKYQKAGIRPEIVPIIEKIDQESFQSALRKIADDNLGITGHTKKMYLAYPICRYADDKLIEHLTSIAPKWKSSVSGNDAPPLRTFRDAVIYHNSRAAMLFAEKYKDLDEYASIRNTTADAIRDNHMSDVGLAPDGTKNYDLGNQMVTVKLLPDLTLSLTTSSGKVVKSIPKKDADPEKYAAANADFSEIKKSIKKIATARKNQLFEAFLNEKKHPAKDWMEAYLNNPLLRQIASILVWCQDKKTFTIGNDGPIDSSGNAYTISENVPICVAHPMEMTADDIRAWQKYFSDRKLKQPFLQVWEPVVDANFITPDRYDGIEIPFNFLRNSQKHGIYIEDCNFHDEIDITLSDCHCFFDCPDKRRHTLPEKIVIQDFKIEKLTRKNNHIIALLDRWTIAERIAKDNTPLFTFISNATLAQLTYYIDIANKNNAVNCMAELLELKNKNYPDFDPMDEYSLDW